jgi:hypothetical protein
LERRAFRDPTRQQAEVRPAGEGIELSDPGAAWIEMTKMLADFVGGAAQALEPNSEWRMELLDEANNPLIRIRLVAERLYTASAGGLFPSRLSAADFCWAGDTQPVGDFPRFTTA